MFKGSKHSFKAALVTGVALSISTLAAAAETTAISPVHSAKSKLADIGTLVRAENEAKPLSITVYLKLRNEAELNALIEDQKTPGHPQFGHYLTPEEFHARFSPLPADVARVKSELTKLGFKPFYTAKNSLFVRASGTVGAAKTAFHVSQDLYNVSGKLVRSYREEPVVPASIAGLVVHVGGLDGSHAFIHPMIKSYRKAINTAASQKGRSASDPGPFEFYTPSPCNVDFGAQDVKATLTPAPAPYGGTYPFSNCGYTSKQLQTAYGVTKVPQTGKYMRIGIVDLLASPTVESDLNQYSALNGLPQVNYTNFVQIVPPDVADGPDYTACGAASDWATEETLDVEAAHSLAPNASLIYFGGACANGDGLPDVALYEAIDTRMADILTNSWGEPEFVIPEGQLEAGDQAFKEAAVLGETILVSSGDAGDFIAEGATMAAVSWPAASPYVTAVGGTSLLLNHDGTKSEYPWGNNIDQAVESVWTGPFQIEAGGWFGWGYSGGAGGGRSIFYSQPSYQKNVVPKSLSYYTYTLVDTPVNMGTPNRVVPDIAMVADLSTGISLGETFIESTPGTADLSCVVTDAAKSYEFCQIPIGGTSLASPAMAGVLALVGEARLDEGKAPLGFANPEIYKLKTGMCEAEPITDIVYPSSPKALITQYFDGPLLIISLDSAPDSTGTKVINGIGDSTLSGGAGFDSTTGLGVPWVPTFLKALK